MTFEATILRTGETSVNAKVNQARTNFGYEAEDLIVITRNGKPVQMETLEGAQNALNDTTISTLEAAMTALLAALNTPQEG